MAAKPNIYDAGRRRLALTAELRDRERDGWIVIDRSEFEATLIHQVRPPWFRSLLDLVLILLGGGVGRSAERILNVQALEGGRVFRATIGDIPPRWPRNRGWEVPDGWDDDIRTPRTSRK